MNRLTILNTLQEQIMPAFTRSAKRAARLLRTPSPEPRPKTTAVPHAPVRVTKAMRPKAVEVDNVPSNFRAAKADLVPSYRPADMNLFLEGAARMAEIRQEEIRAAEAKGPADPPKVYRWVGKDVGELITEGQKMAAEDRAYSQPLMPPTLGDTHTAVKQMQYSCGPDDKASYGMLSAARDVLEAEIAQLAQ